MTSPVSLPCWHDAVPSPPGNLNENYRNEGYSPTDRLDSAYEVSISSGLRANELRNLSIEHLDHERGGLRLDASWTKNRKADFQPLPASLVQRLHAFGQSKEAAHHYRENLLRGNGHHEPPANPLLYVPSQPSRSFRRDLKAADIPVETRQGKLNFHATRVAYINFLLETGKASPKDVQELARHSTLDLTMNTYGRAREDRARAVVEQVGELVETVEKRVRCVQ